MGLSQKDQTKHNTLLRLGMQSVKRRQRPQFRVAECHNRGCTGDIKASFKQWLRSRLPAVENSINKMHCTWWGVLRRCIKCKSIIFCDKFFMNFVSLFIEQPAYFKKPTRALLPHSKFTTTHRIQIIAPQMEMSLLHAVNTRLYNFIMDFQIQKII